MKKITLQLNNFFANKDLVSELHKKNINYKVGAMECFDTIWIDNVCEIRHFGKTIDIIVDNYDKIITIKNDDIRYMEVI